MSKQQQQMMLRLINDIEDFHKADLTAIVVSEGPLSVVLLQNLAAKVQQTYPLAKISDIRAALEGCCLHTALELDGVDCGTMKRADQSVNSTH